MQILTQQVWGGLEVLQFSQALDDAGVAGPGTTLGKAGLWFVLALKPLLWNPNKKMASSLLKNEFHRGSLISRTILLKTIDFPELRS